mmetsp:Transcript_23565/g.82054  ORF Transcript_23565/g.82054 Transcript_23565/m.82054 type:complete len:721 (-) Transcript_23565:114-2276(-)
MAAAGSAAPAPSARSKALKNKFLRFCAPGTERMDLDGFGHFLRSCNGLLLSPAERRKHFIAGVVRAAGAAPPTAEDRKALDFKAFVRSLMSIAQVRFPFVSSPGQALEGLLQTVVLVGEPEERMAADDEGDAVGAAAPLGHTDSWHRHVEDHERPDSGEEFVAPRGDAGSDSTSAHEVDDGDDDAFGIAGHGHGHRGGKRSPVSSVAARAAEQASFRLRQESPVPRVPAVAEEVGAASRAAKGPLAAVSGEAAIEAAASSRGGSVSRSVPPPPPPGLPPGAVKDAEWRAFVDPRGYTYYHHEATGATTWEAPAEAYWDTDEVTIVLPDGTKVVPSAASSVARGGGGGGKPEAGDGAGGGASSDGGRARGDSDAVAALLARTKASTSTEGDPSADPGRPPRRLIGESGGSGPGSSAGAGAAGGAGRAPERTPAGEPTEETKMSQLRAARLRGPTEPATKAWGAGLPPSHLEEESAGRGALREHWRGAWTEAMNEGGSDGKKRRKKGGSVSGASSTSRASSEGVAFAAGVKGSYVLAHTKPDSSPRKRKEAEAEKVYYSNSDIGATSWTAKGMNPRYDHKSATSLQRATVNQLSRNGRSDDRDFVALLRPELYDRAHVPKAAERPKYKTYSNKAYRRKQQADRDAGKSVFERLTDHKAYTGTHKHRFDADGRGRGMYGRDTALEDSEIFSQRMKDIGDEVPHWLELNPVTRAVNSSKLAARI